MTSGRRCFRRRLMRISATSLAAAACSALCTSVSLWALSARCCIHSPCSEKNDITNIHLSRFRHIQLTLNELLTFSSIIRVFRNSAISLSLLFSSSSITCSSYSGNLLVFCWRTGSVQMCNGASFFCLLFLSSLARNVSRSLSLSTSSLTFVSVLESSFRPFMVGYF